MPTDTLYKVPNDPHGTPVPAKVSEMFLEFAEPLLSADPSGPPNIAAVRSVVQLAEMAWNLPVLEARRSPHYPFARKLFHQALGAMPGLASRLMRQLIKDRTTRFAAIPFSIVVRVEGSSLDDLKIVAEARMPPPAEHES